jgi:hypothetical protein
VTRLRVAAGCALGCLLASVAFAAPGSAATASSPAAQPVSTRLGTAWDHHTLDPGGDAAAISRGKTVLANASDMETQALMGWGAGDPEPSPSNYDWSSLDRRIGQISALRKTPVLTLCCAPSWMRTDPAPGTDWSQLASAPSPAHYRDFATLAAAAAARYPQVRYFQVWNELKGFWNRGLNRWDYEAYTELYNDVYDAVRAVRPDAIIGGPYVVIDSYHAGNPAPSALHGGWGSVDQRDLDVITYWLAHAHGAQFVTIDMTTATRDAGVVADPATMSGKATAVLSWLRHRTTLPIWLAEFYAPAKSTSAAAIAGSTLVALSAVERAGAAAVHLWSPERQPGASCGECLFTSTLSVGGGTATRLGTLAEWWHTRLASHRYQRMVTLASGIFAIEGTTGPRAARTDWVLVNTRSTRVAVSYAGATRTLAAYGAVTGRG